MVEGFRGSTEADVGDWKLSLPRPVCFDIDVWRLGVWDSRIEAIPRGVSKCPAAVCSSRGAFKDIEAVHNRNLAHSGDDAQ